MESPGRNTTEVDIIPGWSARMNESESGNFTPGIYYHNDKRSRSFRFGDNRKRRRAVQKNGEYNVLQIRNSRRKTRFLHDIFTNLVEAQWRWTLIAFILSFIMSWLGFAVVWWIISLTHADLNPHHLPSNQADSNWTPCISNINSFTSCFLYSIETQHTIGYGSRLPNEECPEAIIMVCVQSIFGVMMQAFMVGIVFAKMTRSKHSAQTLLFSKCAVVCQRDGEMCLMFRVADMRKSHIIGAGIRAQLIRGLTTKEGEFLPQYQSILDVKADSYNANLFLIWPQTVVHTINKDSPLYGYSANDLNMDRFEIVVILDGTVESTGQSTQARTSYTTNEILWGRRFEPILSYNKVKQGYSINYSNFEKSIKVNTPLCSAKDIDDFYALQQNNNQENNESLTLRKPPRLTVSESALPIEKAITS